MRPFILYKAFIADYHRPMREPTSSMNYLLYPLKHPAGVVAVVYLVTCLAIWADGIGTGAWFGALCTGGVNAVLIILASACREGRTLPMGTALTLCALLLFAFIPLIHRLIEQLPTDAQAAVAIPFCGGAACGLHLAVSLVLCGIVYWCIRSSKRNA